MIWTVCVLCLLGPVQETRTVEPTVGEGLQALPVPDMQNLEPGVREQLTASLKQLEETLARKDPDLAGEAYAQTGELFHAYAMTTQAEICYRNAMALDSFRLSTVYMAACLLEESARLDEARDLMRTFLKKHDDFAPGWYRLGDMALQSGDLDEAATAFARARDLRPEVAAPETGLGRLAMARDQPMEAIGHFERALTLLPRATRLNYHLAMAWRKAGDQDKARTFMARAGKIGTKMPDPIYARLKERTSSERLFLSDGKTAFAAGDLEGAARLYGKALEANPDSMAGHINLGSTLAKLGRLPEAVAEFRAALALNDKNTTALYNLASLLAADGQVDEAEALLTRLLTQKSADAGAHFLLAQILRAKGRTEEALTHYEATAYNQPRWEPAVMARAELLLELGRWARAAEVLAQDHAANPDMGRLVHLYARFLATCPERGLRNGTLAVSLAEAVAAVQPIPLHLETLALALAEAGRCDDAAAAQQRALAVASGGGGSDTLVARLNADLARYRRGAPCAAGDP